MRYEIWAPGHKPVFEGTKTKAMNIAGYYLLYSDEVHIRKID